MVKALELREQMKSNYLRSREIVFEKLPDVLIQDAKELTAYYIKASQLQKFSTKGSDLGALSQNTVTFLIPDENYIGEVPIAFAHENPSVLIQFPKGKTSFFVENHKLAEFEVPLLNEIPDNCLCFILPNGDDFMEDIPDMSPAMLQSNENPNPIGP